MKPVVVVAFAVVLIWAVIATAVALRGWPEMVASPGPAEPHSTPDAGSTLAAAFATPSTSEAPPRPATDPAPAVERCPPPARCVCPEPGKPVSIEEMARSIGAPRADDSPMLRKLRAGCASGEGDDCYYVAVQAETSGDLPQANGASLRGCELKDESACVRLGYNLVRGLGAQKDVNRGLGYLRTACENDEEECWSFGFSLAEVGDGPRALEAYQRACNARYNLACDSAGDLLIEGKYGVPLDVPGAAVYYETACDLGRKEGCSALVEIYSRWLVDPAKALAFRKKACERGSMRDCDALAR